MEIGNGGRRGGLSYPSHDSHGSRASMRMRRKTYDESYFYGLKTMIKKSRTAENLDRLFHACQRYRKGSHCYYFKWVDDDDYQGVVVGGTKKDTETDLEVENAYDEWRVKVAWRLGSLKAEVKALKLLIIFMFVVVVISVILYCLICTSKYIQLCY
ncbi:hypothetical protein Ahy_B02g059891 [Arachis hypogaea]|uniref:Zinc finger GRF-type domain-containing protein n=1 Tax=Arachis hypogaea TaxID=3818 RepID=A0A445AHJ4_ARAHY|nr:hypothetical protein Ahy_B02g059891 [Arachis hypogaea]